MREEQKNFLATLVQGLSSLETKTIKLLNWYKSIVEDEITEDVKFDLYGMLEFFSKNSNVNKKYLLNGLNEFLDITDKYKEAIFDVLPIEKYRIRLEILRSKLLFQKSSSYWKWSYKIEEEDTNSAEEFKARFDLIYDKKRPVLTRKIGILQEAHDSFEKHKCCVQNREFLHFYFKKLLSIANSGSVQYTLYSDAKFLPIIENVKDEIVRLLKCVYGKKLDNRLCSHATLKSCKSVFRAEISANIVAFYFPSDVLESIGNNKIDGETYEVFRMTKHMFEKEVQKYINKDFRDYLSELQQFVPMCESLIHNGDQIEYKKFESNLEEFHTLKFSCVEQIKKETRLFLAKHFYFWAYDQFKKSEDECVINLGIKAFVFGKNVLDGESIAHIWFMIGKCLFNEMGLEFDVNQCNRIIFSFHISLLLNIGKAEPHLWLAMALHRLYLNDTSQTTHLEHSSEHIESTEAFIRDEKEINRFVTITNDFLTADQYNYIDGKGEAGKNFIQTSLNWLTDLIKEKRQDIKFYSPSFIEKTNDSLLEFIERLKGFDSSECSGYNSVLIEKLTKTWGNVIKEKEDEQSGQFSDISCDELDEENEDSEEHANKSIHQSIVVNKLTGLTNKELQTELIDKETQSESTNREVQTEPTRKEDASTETVNCTQCQIVCDTQIELTDQENMPTESNQNQLSVDSSQTHANELNAHKNLLNKTWDKECDEKVNNIVEQLKQRLEMEQQKLCESKQKLDEFKQTVNDSENSISQLKLEIVKAERDAKILKLETDLKGFISERTDMFKENEQLTETVEQNTKTIEQLKNDNEKMRQLIKEEDQEEERQMAAKRRRSEEKNKMREAKRARRNNVLNTSQES